MSKIEVRFLSPDEERLYGFSFMPHAPRIGETIWLLNIVDPIKGLDGSRTETYRVVNICYWVPNRSEGFANADCNSCAVYIEPIDG